MKHEPEEYELALRARAGDREALGELVERTRLRLFALAYAELRHYEDAQDAVASALLQICRHITELREPERVRAWMQSIVRNEVRRLRRGPDAATLRLEEMDAVEDETGPSLLRLDIERALRRLPGEQAWVSRLFYLANLSIAEIARRTGRPEGTIKSWLHRGRQRLAHEMEEYAPMRPIPAPEPTRAHEPTPAPVLKAAVIHTALEIAVVQSITDALRTGGYDVHVITPGEPPLLHENLARYDAVVLDETLGGRSALEWLMHLRSHPETRHIPIGQLASDPSEFTTIAYFTAGVDRLVNKNKPDEVAKLATPIERPREGLWGRFTNGAKQATSHAQEEAAALGTHMVGTEHLLLGLIWRADCAGARMLTRLGVSIESIRTEILAQTPRGPGTGTHEMLLTPRAKRVMDLAREESARLNNNYIGTEHLLLGLIREGDGLAARVLVKLGADLERARRELQAMQARPGA